MSKTIIDNTKDNLLIDYVNHLLTESEFSGMAVGYFYLSGFEAIQKSLQSIKNGILKFQERGLESENMIIRTIFSEGLNL
jgi:hypothetical protein